MPLNPPYPSIEELMSLIGEAGGRLAEIEASEGAAGNISIYFKWETEPHPDFLVEESIALPEPAPELEGGYFLVSGSGRRLREIGNDPEANLGLLRVNPGGETARLYTSKRCLFTRLTSEFNSHLAVHRDQIKTGGHNFHALIHAQPLHLTYLSHIPRYQDEGYLNRHILRWQPESIVNLSEGVGFIPFLVPGSPQLMQANVEAMRSHRVVLWAKHGIMARSDLSVKRACDLVEYAETGAKYEYLNLTNHGLAMGLSRDEIRAICQTLNIEQTIF
jgi:rhamnulose-1-phosphate aldolase